MDARDNVGSLDQQTALEHWFSCSSVVTSIRETCLTEHYSFRTIVSWEKVGVFTVFYLTYIFLFSVTRLFASFCHFHCTVFHFQFLRETLVDIIRVKVEWCKVNSSCGHVPRAERTFFRKAYMFLQHLRNSLNGYIFKCVSYYDVFIPTSVLTSLRYAWLSLTDVFGMPLHYTGSRFTIHCNKYRIRNNRNCNKCTRGLVYITNRLAGMFISSLKYPFLFSLFKITTLLLMLRPISSAGMGAHNEESLYPSSYGQDYGSYQYGKLSEPEQPLFGVEPGYKYSYYKKLPKKVMTEGVIICLLAGTAFIGLVVWLAKTNFKESQQRRMRREASLRDRTLLVQSEDDIV